MGTPFPIYHRSARRGGGVLLTFIQYQYGHNKREIRNLLYHQTRTKNLLRHYEKRIQLLNANLEQINKEIEELKPKKLTATYEPVDFPQVVQG